MVQFIMIVYINVWSNKTDLATHTILPYIFQGFIIKFPKHLCIFVTNMMIQDKIDFKMVFSKKTTEDFCFVPFFSVLNKKTFFLSSRLTNRMAIINTFLIWYGCHNTKLSINFGKHSLKVTGVTIVFTITKGKLLLCMLPSVTKFTRIPFSWYLYRAATRTIP